MNVFRTAASTTALALLPLILGAAKPVPVPSSFTPALSYRYGGTDIRLSNADGSQAVLLVRMPLGPNAIVSVLQHSLAPLEQRQAAFVYGPDGTHKELRLVDWSQPTPGGPLSVTLDPAPLFSITGTGAEITSVDYSADGTRIYAVSWIQGRDQQLRIFDVATRLQVGDPIPLALDGSNTHWRQFDGSLLMRGSAGFTSYKDGVQTFLFNTGIGGYFDAFNGTASDVVIQNVVNGESTLQRWDGTTITSAGPALTTLTQGYQPTVNCDNSRMLFQRNSPRSKTILYTFGTRTETAFSQDGSISFLVYPNGCG